LNINCAVEDTRSSELNDARFEVFVTILLRIQDLGYVTACHWVCASFVSKNRSAFLFKGQPFKMEAPGSSETSGSTNPAEQHHISGDLNLQNRSIVCECVALYICLIKCASLSSLMS
jgi:hypothetical protein